MRFRSITTSPRSVVESDCAWTVPYPSTRQACMIVLSDIKLFHTRNRHTLQNIDAHEVQCPSTCKYVRLYILHYQITLYPRMSVRVCMAGLLACIILACLP